MISSIYITGFRDSNLTDEEKSKLDDIKSKHATYKIMDGRDGDFESIRETFKDEGKNIIIYAEITNADENKKNEVIESAKEMKKMLPNITIEVNDEEKKLL